MQAYLDYNATAPARPQVIAAMADVMRDPSNASSIHGYGRKARKIVDEAREKIASFIGADANQIIFTSGGTEANNTALSMTDRKRILISAVEHDSVRLVRPDVEVIPVDHNGIVDLAALDKMLAAGGEPALVCIMFANNETGVIQPVKQAAEIAHKYGALLFADAVQALGKIPVNFKDIGADMMSVSAHKAGGPQGIGALVFTDNVKLKALLKGGGQERSRRAGTENVAAIAGFGALIDCLKAETNEAARLLKLREKLEQRLLEILPDATIFGLGAARLPNTVSLAYRGMPSSTQVMRADMAGIAVSSGAACSSGKVKPSHVLSAMGADPELVSSALRVSIGWATAEKDIEEFLAFWPSLFQGPAVKAA